MEEKKNNFMGDIYSSYGPFVGRICENTNTQLQQDNLIESITSSINSIEKSIHTPNIENNSSKNINSFVEDVQQQAKAEIKSINNEIKLTKNSKISNHKSTKNYKAGGNNLNLNLNLQENKNIFKNNNIEEDEESSNFFTYKISIYNYKISIWILLLILLILICIGYFIYKYWYLKNTNIISYKKNILKNDIYESFDKISVSSNNLSNNLSDNLSNNSSNNSSNDSSNNSTNNLTNNVSNNVSKNLSNNSSKSSKVISKN